VDLRPNQVKRASKRGPLGLRRLIQGTNHGPRQTPKRRVREAGEQLSQRPPRAVEATMIMAAPKPPRCFGFFPTFRFPT